MTVAFDGKDLLRQDLRAMNEYAPGKTVQSLAAELGVPVERIVKLDANENPYGSSPKVYQALADCRHYCRYPDADQTALREGLAANLGIGAEHIVAGNGSDEMIDLLLKLVASPGDIIINCPPTFGVYAFTASLYRARVVDIPRGPNFELDIEAIEAGFRSGELSGAKMLIICSPNNPDGGVTPPEDIERLLRLPVLLVLDEAYVEFSGNSLASWVTRYPNLVVLRTFSKWLGLAGLRVGYGILPLAIARELWKIKPPYNVNVAAQIAALAALEDQAFVEDCRHKILAERERLYEALKTVSFLQPYPSHTNFVLARVLDRPAAEVKRQLERRGILIRGFGERRLQDHIRISVGRPEETDALVRALREIE